MGMSLLKPSQVKDLRNEELNKTIFRTQEVTRALNDANIRLAKVELDFNNTLIKNRIKWEEEEKEHSERLLEMKEEVKILEDRKRQALIPIQMYKDQADLLLNDAKLIKEEWEIKNHKIDELQEQLEDKLDSLSSRESDVLESEKKLNNRKKGIDQQAENTALNAEQLTLKMIDFSEYQKKEEEKLKERKKLTDIIEINIQAKLDKIARDIEAIRVEKIKLADMRGVLETELNKLSPFK